MTPRASREKLVFESGVLKVYVCAAPTDGEANKAVIALVAKALRVPKSSISIRRGESSRDKVLRIDGLTPSELEERVRSA